MFEEQSKKEEKERDFDIAWLIRYIWAKRRLVCKVVAVTVVISVIAYFCRQKTYTCTASVLPLSAKPTGLGGLSSLAGLAGLSMEGSSNKITPDLFSEVALSTPSLIEIMNQPVTWEDPDTIESLYSRTKRDTIPTVAGYIAMFTIRLPFTIKDALTKKPDVVAEIPNEDGDDGKMRAIVIDKAMEQCIKDLQERIYVEVDDEVNLVRVECTAENAKQSTELTAAVLTRIQEAVTEFSTKNARKNLKFAEEQYDLTFAEFEKRRDLWLKYKDSHRYVVEERASVEYNKLYEDYNLASSLLVTVQQQLATNKMELATNTPAFSIVEPIVQPTKKTSPKMLLHLIGGLFIGLVISVGGLLVTLGYKQVFKPSEYERILDMYAGDIK